MGATNAIKAFDQYAGLVPPVSLLLLVRMALLSRDDDPDPWFGEGHAALARSALGRGRHAEVNESDIKAVLRAFTPLHKIGAITTIRHGAVRHDGPNTACYRLNLTAVRTSRKTGGVRARQERADPPENGRRESVHTSRKTGGVEGQMISAHLPENVRTPPGKWVAHLPESVPLRRQEETRGEVQELVTGPPVAKILRFPTGELVPVSSVPIENAGTITAAWIDHCKARNVILPSDVIGHYAKLIKRGLDDGFDPSMIKRALARMLDEGQVGWPSSLSRYLVRVQEVATAPAKPSTTDQRVAAALAAGEEAQRIYDEAQAAKIKEIR